MLQISLLQGQFPVLHQSLKCLQSSGAADQRPPDTVYSQVRLQELAAQLTAPKVTPQLQADCQRACSELQEALDCTRRFRLQVSCAHGLYGLSWAEVTSCCSEMCLMSWSTSRCGARKIFMRLLTAAVFLRKSYSTQLMAALVRILHALALIIWRMCCSTRTGALEAPARRSALSWA